MVYKIEEIRKEWQNLGGYGDFSKYLARWYVATYDHKLTFVGFKRSGDNETSYSGIY